MLGFKIWGTAQLINVVAYAIFSKDIWMAIVASPFAFVGGLPALFIFNAILCPAIGNSSPIGRFWLSLIFMPAVTACCSFGVLQLLDPNDNMIQGMAAIPVAATIASVLIFNRPIRLSTQMHSDNDTNP